MIARRSPSAARARASVSRTRPALAPRPRGRGAGGRRGRAQQQRTAVALGQRARRSISSSASSGRSSRRSRFETATRRAADAPADLLARQPELLDERRAGARLLDRVEVLAGHVLDQRELERLGVVVRAHERRDRVQARRAAPHASGARRRSARSVPPGTGRTSTGWSTPALAGASRRARRSASSSKCRRGWCGFGDDQLDRDSRSSRVGLAARARTRRAGSPPRPRPMPRRALSHARPPPWPARSTRRSPRSAGRGGSPGARSSAPRRAARCAGSRCRTRATGSARAPRARRPAPACVRASCIVSSIPATVSRGLSSRWMSDERVEQARRGPRARSTRSAPARSPGRPRRAR